MMRRGNVLIIFVIILIVLFLIVKSFFPDFCSIRELKSKIEYLQKINFSLEQNITEIKKSYSNLINNFEKVVYKNKELLKENESLKNKISLLEKNLSEEMKKNRYLQNQIKEYKKKLNEYKKSFVNLYD